MTSHEMATRIFKLEARRDDQGNLAVYELPKRDGGGAFEVAGINANYDPNMAPFLAWLVKNKRFQEAEEIAISYIEFNTDKVKGWSSIPAVEFLLRDAAFNRGVTGAARILQHAVGVQTDGQVGPKTKAAMASKTPETLVALLRASREWYERTIVGVRDEFMKGLISRWDQVTEIAQGDL